VAIRRNGRFDGLSHVQPGISFLSTQQMHLVTIGLLHEIPKPAGYASEYMLTDVSIP
jgi:hypothetical protein